MVYTVTLNPAVDKIIFIQSFERTLTQRIERTLETIGGKGTHVSINLSLLGVENVALGVTLGETGRKITGIMQSYGVEPRFLHYDLDGLESRTNYELVETDGHHCTMLTERGPMLPQDITDALLEQLQSLLKADDILVLTGDARNVADTSIYSRLIHEAKALGAKVILDTSGPYLAQGLQAGPFLIKPNYEELCYLAGRTLRDEQDIVNALDALGGNGVEMAVMTWSSNGAIAKHGGDIFRVYPLQVNAVNEVGCGDAFLSAFIAGLCQNESMESILKRATATAAACAELEVTVGFDPARVLELYPSVVVKRISGK